MKMGEGFQEAERRLEAGEDPDEIDEAMGAVLSSEDPSGKKRGRKGSALRKPRIDEVMDDL
ncbi:MAG: hypothetical protein K4571_10840 [Deltaproteobacteria bacterium]